MVHLLRRISWNRPSSAASTNHGEGATSTTEARSPSRNAQRFRIAWFVLQAVRLEFVGVDGSPIARAVTLPERDSKHQSNPASSHPALGASVSRW